MNPQISPAQVTAAQYEFIGRQAFENALLKGDLQTLQARVAELEAQIAVALGPKPVPTEPKE